MFRNLTLDKIVRFLIGLAAVALITLILYNYINLVAYAIIAILLSYLLDPVVSRMQSAGMNRTFSITLTLASVILIIVWVSTSIIPILANQMASLTRQLSLENILFIADQVEAQLISNFDFLQAGFLRENIARISDDLFDSGRLPDLLANLIGLFTNLFAAVIVIPFATFFFLKDGSRIRRDLLQLVPNRYFETILSLIDKIETRLGIYFRSVFIQSILVAASAWLTLTVAGLSNAASVGVTIGVANTIPYFGPLLGYILSMIISIIETGDFSLVLPCLLAIFVVQLLDNVVFQPLLFSKSADMHPVAILFIILIGAETAGLLGMLIAIPIATIIKITIKQINWSFDNYYIFRVDPSSSGDTDPPVHSG